MQQYLRQTKSMIIASQNDEFKFKSNKKEPYLDPANFLNNIDAVPNHNQRIKSESISLLSNQTQQKREMKKTQHTKFLVLPKIDSKFIRDSAVEDVYFLSQTNQQQQNKNKLIHPNTVLQPLLDRPVKSFKDLDQLQAKKKKVEFNTALEIVDFEGRVSTEIINPEQQVIPRQKRFSRLKTLEC